MLRRASELSTRLRPLQRGVCIFFSLPLFSCAISSQPLSSLTDIWHRAGQLLRLDPLSLRGRSGPGSQILQKMPRPEASSVRVSSCRVRTTGQRRVVERVSETGVGGPRSGPEMKTRMVATWRWRMWEMMVEKYVLPCPSGHLINVCISSTQF